jgi:hypothetical protein
MTDAYFNILKTPQSQSDYILTRINRIQNDLDATLSNLDATYVKGRLRFDRPAPANSADVNDTDLLYDRVLTVTFEYILINNAGTLNWVRSALSTF